MAIGEVFRARIDPEIKNSANSVLAAAGLTISDAFRALLTIIARDRKLPFERLPTTNMLPPLKAEPAISNGARPPKPLSAILQAKPGVPDGRMPGLSETEARTFFAEMGIS